MAEEETTPETDTDPESVPTTWKNTKLIDIFDFGNDAWVKKFSAHPLYHLEEEATLYELADLGPDKCEGAEFSLLDSDTSGILLD
jgi:hypothetical protein